jgi:hypothetical protein
VVFELLVADFFGLIFPKPSASPFSSTRIEWKAQWQKIETDFVMIEWLNGVECVKKCCSRQGLLSAAPPVVRPCN